MTSRAPAAADGGGRAAPRAPPGASSQPRGGLGGWGGGGHPARRSRRPPPRLSGWAPSGSGGGVTCALPRAPPALQAPRWDVGARLARRAPRLTRHLRSDPLRPARRTPSRHLPRLPAPFLPLALRAEESEATSSRKVPQSPARLSRRPSPRPPLARASLPHWVALDPRDRWTWGTRGHVRDAGKAQTRTHPREKIPYGLSSSLRKQLILITHDGSCSPSRMCPKVVGVSPPFPPIHLLIHSHIPHSQGARSIRVVGGVTGEEENRYLVCLEKQQYFNLETPEETAGAPQAYANHMQSDGNLERKPPLARTRAELGPREDSGYERSLHSPPR